MLRRILIIDDEENMLHMLSATLKREGYDVITAKDGKLGLFNIMRDEIPLILCDLKMPEMDGLAFLQALQAEKLNPLVIMMSAFATIDTAVQAMRLGAYDFVTKPFKTDEILCVLDKAWKYIEIAEDNKILKQKLEALNKPEQTTIIGKNRDFNNVLNLARKVALHDTTVLITGESGTGKELMARLIQENSSRADKSFVKVNCASIPSSLMESEFFGHVKGAFSGADQDRKGLFVEANHGTIFLDEIGELSLEMQVKLLRVLQERELRPVGSNRTEKIDVRIIAATSKNLQQEVRAGHFREDLLYRLNVMVVQCPPLRERKDDIHLLVAHFINKFCERDLLNSKKISSKAMDGLTSYHWPGNVRELENCIERAIIVAEGDVIQPDDLHFAAADSSTQEQGGGKDMFRGVCSVKEGKKMMEHHLISKALKLTEGNKSQAAQLLEISYPSLLSKIKELGIEE